MGKPIGKPWEKWENPWEKWANHGKPLEKIRVFYVERIH
jgi:hypothetical protein